MNKVVTEIRDLLKEKEFRLTPQREAIIANFDYN